MNEMECQQYFRDLHVKKANGDKGRIGEDIWRTVLKRLGYNVSNLSAIREGGAPMSRGVYDLILPDIQAFKPGVSFTFTVEIKWKTSPWPFDHARELVHGIDTNNYAHYCDYEALCGQTSFLAIFEAFADPLLTEWSGYLLFNSLAELAPATPSIGGTPKVFWPRRKFRTFARLTACQAVNVKRLEFVDLDPFKDRIQEIISTNMEHKLQRAFA